MSVTSSSNRSETCDETELKRLDMPVLPCPAAGTACCAKSEQALLPATLRGQADVLRRDDVRSLDEEASLPAF